jgi:hypothetical protein
MANIKDLEKFAEDIIPVLKDLFPRASADSEAPPADPALEATRKLQKLVAETRRGTAATNLEAAAAVTAVRRALLAVLMGAATSNVALSQTDANIIEVQFNALESRAGQLLAQAAFARIPTLITPDEITQIEATLRRATAEIQQRQQAKQVLDGVVQTVITAARLAAKIAA